LTYFEDFVFEDRVKMRCTNGEVISSPSLNIIRYKNVRVGSVFECAS